MVNIQNVLLCLECTHRDVCTTGRWDRQLHSVTLQLTYQSDAKVSDHSHPALFLVDSLPRCCN